jgi:hypothetical protein
LPSSRGIFYASSSLYIWKDNQINEPFQHMKITKREMYKNSDSYRWSTISKHNRMHDVFY